MSEQAAQSPSVSSITAPAASVGKNFTRLAVGFLWVLWVVSALPLASLIFEFNDCLDECMREGWYYAKLYSHFFLYPVTFGFFSTLFLTLPWLHALRNLWSLPRGSRLRVAAFLMASVVFIVGFISYMEFSEAPNTLAIWAVKRDVLSDGNNQKVLAAKAVLEKKCRSTDWKTSDIVKGKFGKLKELHNESKSITQVFYYFGFVSMTTLFAVLFAVVIITTALNKASTNAGVGILSAATVFASFWALIRFGYLDEKIDLYGEGADSLLIFNYFVFGAFIVLYFHLITAYWAKFRPYDKFVKFLLGVATSVIAALDVLMPELIIRIFGSRSSAATYVAAILLLLVIFAPNVIRWLRRELPQLR